MHHFNKENPYVSHLIKREKLSLDGSTKDTYHLELSIDPKVFSYRCGDSIAVKTQNPTPTTESWFTFFSNPLNQISLNPQQSMQIRMDIELGKVSKRTYQKILDFFKIEENYEYDLESADLLDIVQWAQTLNPRPFCFEDLLSIAPKMAPRYYSISSSPSLDPSTIALTVALVQYQTHKTRIGACSYYLCKDLNISEPLSIWLHPTRNFTLPSKDQDMIMIGPGTGIAPFRSFILERIEQQSRARHWLFFGERQEKYDFYYKKLWDEIKTTIDFKLSLAFSRDQAEKIYVQDRLWQERFELWKWIERKAHIYLCGDASHMAKDVEKTLMQIAHEVGKIPLEEGKAWLRSMLKEGTYHKDVY